MAAKELMALGLPAELAKRLGGNPSTLNAILTVQATAAAIGLDNNAINLVTDGSNTAARLPVGAELFRPYFIFVLSATTGLIFPPTGHKINAAATDASVAIATQLGRIFIKVNSTNWVSFLAA